MLLFLRASFSFPSSFRIRVITHKRWLHSHARCFCSVKKKEKKAPRGNTDLRRKSEQEKRILFHKVSYSCQIVFSQWINEKKEETETLCSIRSLLLCSPNKRSIVMAPPFNCGKTSISFSLDSSQTLV